MADGFKESEPSAGDDRLIDKEAAAAIASVGDQDPPRSSVRPSARWFPAAVRSAGPCERSVGWALRALGRLGPAGARSAGPCERWVGWALRALGLVRRSALSFRIGLIGRVARADERTDGWTDGRKDGRMDERRHGSGSSDMLRDVLLWGVGNHRRISKYDDGRRRRR